MAETVPSSASASTEEVTVTDTVLIASSAYVTMEKPAAMIVIAARSSHSLPDLFLYLILSSPCSFHLFKIFSFLCSPLIRSPRAAYHGLRIDTIVRYAGLSSTRIPAFAERAWTILPPPIYMAT